MKLSGRLGTLFLAIWLILNSLVQLTTLTIPSGNLILGILALAAGILILTEIRTQVSRNLGRLLLSIWLILAGLIPLLSLSFPASTTILAVLAIAAGILLLLGR
jgi:hypothetical protein